MLTLTVCALALSYLVMTTLFSAVLRHSLLHKHNVDVVHLAVDIGNALIQRGFTVPNHLVLSLEEISSRCILHHVIIYLTLILLSLRLLLVLFGEHVFVDAHFVYLNLHLAEATLAYDEEFLQYFIKDGDAILEWNGHWVLARKQILSRHLRSN